jgi:quinoprotein glucose dehydrogenase
VRYVKKVIGASLLAGLAWGGAGVVQSQAAREWRYYGGDHAFTRYSPLDQINRDNVKNVKIAWRRAAVNPALTSAFPDLKVNGYLKSTPIVIDGVVYTQDAHGLVTAFDGATGKTIWEQEAPKEEAAGDPTRGLDYWRSGSDERIIAIRGEHLYALNAKTGKPAVDFGERGGITLHFDTPQPPAQSSLVTSW